MSEAYRGEEKWSILSRFWLHILELRKLYLELEQNNAHVVLQLANNVLGSFASFSPDSDNDDDADDDCHEDDFDDDDSSFKD